jgi:L-glutamine-phosphate cytidylyltransferase
MIITNAIILAAGLGMRLSPLTKNTPKCLINVNGIPIIERCVSTLMGYGIQNIVVVLGFQSEMIKEFLEKRFDSSEFTYIENPEYISTNNIVSLWLAREYLAEGAFIVESDVIFEETSFQKLADRDIKSLWMVDRFIRGMDGCLLTADKRGRIISIRIVREELGEYTDRMYKSVGLLKLNHEEGRLLAEFLDKEIQDDNRNIYYDLVFSKYLSSFNISICNIEGQKWAEIDNIQDLRYAVKLFS